ncbi:MAG: tetratricopeptide repeat protein [Gemmataceae bacterium]
MAALAHSYQAQGRRPEALKLGEQALALCKEKLGPDHPKTLAIMSNLAVSCHALGRRPEALRLHEQALALRKEKLGPDHPDTLDSVRRVIESLLALKRPDEAQLLIDEGLRLADQAVTKGKTPDPRLKPALIVHRLGIYLDRKDAEGYRQSVEMFEKLGRADAPRLYDAACYRAVLAGMRSGDAAKAEADRAMAWLTRAVAAGYKDRAHMEKDSDLDALRSREDFRKLLTGLPPKPELLPMPRKQ